MIPLEKPRATLINERQLGLVEDVVVVELIAQRTSVTRGLGGAAGNPVLHKGEALRVRIYLACVSWNLPVALQRASSRGVDWKPACQNRGRWPVAVDTRSAVI